LRRGEYLWPGSKTPIRASWLSNLLGDDLALLLKAGLVWR
jgi:hypothetical protein